MQSSAAQRRPLAAAGVVVAVVLIAGVVPMALAADADWRVSDACPLRPDPPTRCPHSL